MSSIENKRNAIRRAGYELAGFEEDSIVSMIVRSQIIKERKSRAEHVENQFYSKYVAGPEIDRILASRDRCAS